MVGDAVLTALLVLKINARIEDNSGRQADVFFASGRTAARIGHVTAASA